MSKRNKPDRADQTRLRHLRNSLTTRKDRGFALPLVRIGSHTCYALSDAKKLGTPEESAIDMTAGSSIDHPTDTYDGTIRRQQ